MDKAAHTLEELAHASNVERGADGGGAVLEEVDEGLAVRGDGDEEDAVPALSVLRLDEVMNREPHGCIH